MFACSEVYIQLSTLSYWYELQLLQIVVIIMDGQFLSIPPHNLDTDARHFSVAAPRLWNSLPLNCRTAPSANTFKTRLKTFLFASA